MTEPQTPRSPKPLPILVKVVDVDISFGQLVVLLVKVAIAAIPAAIILAVIGTIAFAMFAALGSALK